MMTMQQRSDLLRFFDAIKNVEGWTQGDPVGPNGERGPFQITPDFYSDAVEQMQWEKRDVSQMKYKRVETDEAFCRRIILAYFRRHCFYALKIDDFKTLARVYNGGPSATRRPKLAYNYWMKVREAMR